MQHKFEDRVGITIPTMNRSEFIIRQLKYYAKVGCPHTIYIVDSSPTDEFNKTDSYIKNLGDKINVVHKYFPPGPGHLEFLYSLVEEDYLCFCGDDDYQIPDTLTKCAQFLNNNRDYESACGTSVTFRLKWHGQYKPYGELDRLADYPRYSVEFDTATERLNYFFDNYFTALVSVSRTENVKRNYKNTLEIKDLVIRDEILQCGLTLAAGKSKVIDSLGFIHQIHDQMPYHLPDIYDWISGDNWLESIRMLEKRVVKELMAIDKINERDAKTGFKQALWSYFNKQFPREYREKYLALPIKQLSKYKELKAKVGLTFPALKYLYKKWSSKIKGQSIRLHYGVLRPESKYYKDFKPVMDSFTGKLQLKDSAV
ncbi:MAG: TIGR00180 family glycosyltransferase [Patescibacteria group bacterium]